MQSNNLGLKDLKPPHKLLLFTEDNGEVQIKTSLK